MKKSVAETKQEKIRDSFFFEKFFRACEKKRKRLSRLCEHQQQTEP